MTRKLSVPFNSRAPLLDQMKRYGLEFDQLLHRALAISASKPDLDPEDTGFPDSYLTLALYRLNSTISSLVELEEENLNIFHDYKLAPKCSPDAVVPGERLCSVLTKAAELAAPDKTLGVGHFFRAIAGVTRDLGESEAYGFENQVIHSTFSIETLMWGLGYHAWTPLRDAPKVRDILDAFDHREPAEDFQYLMTQVDGKIVLRPISPLQSYNLQSRSGAMHSGLAVLSHFKDQYAAVTPFNLMELEDIINHPRAKEEDFQKFFEKHPEFFRKWDSREIYSRIYLTREEEGPLIPDFLLVDREAQRATILELKLPKSKIIRRQPNRDRFASAVIEARAQLMQYRDWFDDSRNRRLVKDRIGIEIYRPNLGMIIGSGCEFKNAMDRQKLSASMPEVEVVTYDDIINSARRRLMLIGSAE